MAGEHGVRVGVITLALALPGAFSLKDKRAVLRRILDRARGPKRSFNASFAEVGSLDDPRRAVLAAAQVSNDAAHLCRGFEAIRSFVESFDDAVLEAVHTEVVAVDCVDAAHAGEKY